LSWQCLVISSLLVAGLSASAETRPHYGGTAHVSTHAVLTSLDPADVSADSFARRSITSLIFETLVSLDQSGRPQPGLATSWQAEHDGQRWLLRLRHGVKFHDGVAFTSELAAASLRVSNPTWNISTDADSISISCDVRCPNLPAELALSRNAIARKSVDGKLNGTGPFHIADWQAGRKLSLAAEENYWEGRPFLDAIEIEFGKNFREQSIGLELGKTELIEVAPEQSHRLSTETRRVASSAPMELLALEFARDARTPEEKLLRESLALSTDRASIRNVLLQGAGQCAGSILPNWMSGYAFTFTTDLDLPTARHDREQVKMLPTWTIGYDASDPMARLVVERVALNAHDAGLKLQPTSGPSADVQLMRAPLASADPWISLNGLASISGAVKTSGHPESVEDLYQAEKEMIAVRRLIPLFHLPVTYASSTALKQWGIRSDGSLAIDGAWLGEQPQENKRP
jgi:peptide/nickel transport system substrate-binding protein